MMKMSCSLCFAASLLWTIAFSGAAHAHHLGGTPHGTGIAIPGLSHGQMHLVARQRSAILALADEHWAPDRTVQRLRNFVELQHTMCLWMIVPGTISNEASPFNECAHAELAGVRALLTHLLKIPASRAKAMALVELMQRETLSDPATWATCRFGQETFTSDAIVYPRLREFASHPPTMLSFLLPVLLMAGLLFLRCRVNARSLLKPPTNPMA